MELTEGLKRRFCKDCGLAIQVYSEPYFSERVELLGKTKQLRQFEKLVGELFGNEQQYYNYYNMLKDMIINHIKDSEAYQALNNDDMNKYCIKTNIKQGDVFKDAFVGRKLISIDMSKANFSALVYYGKETETRFHNNYSWKDFMSMFTSFDYFYQSKYIRQVVFGNCNPKRQVAYEKYIMNKVLKHIEEKTAFKESDLLTYCNDELVFSAEGHSDEEIKQLQKEVESLTASIIPLTFEHFILGKVVGTDAYVKKLIDNVKEYEVKCAGPSDTVFVNRLLNGDNITDNDLVFVSEGRLARYLEKPELSISYESSSN